MTKTMTKINLREEILAIMGGSNLDPREIAGEVMLLITPENAMSAVEQMLLDHVRKVISSHRTSNGPTVSPESIRQAGDRGQRTPGFSHATGGYVAPPPPRRGGGGRSSKVGAIRDGWQRFLSERVPVGGGKSKLFGDLTYDDMVFAARTRRKNAEDNLKWARRFDAWAALLTQYDAETFRDLPVEVQMQAIGTVD